MGTYNASVGASEGLSAEGLGWAGLDWAGQLITVIISYHLNAISGG